MEDLQRCSLVGQHTLIFDCAQKAGHRTKDLPFVYKICVSTVACGMNQAPGHHCHTHLTGKHTHSGLCLEHRGNLCNLVKDNDPVARTHLVGSTRLVTRIALAEHTDLVRHIDLQLDHHTPQLPTHTVHQIHPCPRGSEQGPDHQHYCLECLQQTLVFSCRIPGD